MAEDAPKDVLYLTVGVEDTVKKLIAKRLKAAKNVDLPDFAAFEKFLEEPEEGPFPLVFAGCEIEGVDPVELAQTLRTQYQNSALFFATESRGEAFQRKTLQKNGFTDAFLLPFDTSALTLALEDFQAQFLNIKTYRSVKLLDIQADTKLNFDVSIYLPMNKKHVVFAGKGDPIEQERMDRLNKHKVNSVYVDKEELPAFYEYSANQLIELGNADNDSMTETERRDRLQSSVRELITEIFDTGSEATVGKGKEVTENSSEIIKQYVLNTSGNKEFTEWYDRISKTIGEQGDVYNHLSNVSTFAALFSMGMQVGKPEDLAMAGLYHDLGMADVPAEIQEKSESEWTPEERAIYEKHPENSIKIMKDRKLTVPEVVYKAVLQHHERWDGSGFPKGKLRDTISKEAEILGLADRFDYLTKVTEGEKAYSPVEAIRHMQKHKEFHPDLLRKALGLMPQDEVNATTHLANPDPVDEAPKKEEDKKDEKKSA